MNAKKIHALLLAVAGIAILLGGCNLSNKRESSAHLRLNKTIAQARLTVARELLEEGNVEYAKRILEPYAPILSEQATDSILLASTENNEDSSNAKSTTRYAKAEVELSDEEQTW